MVVPEVVEIKGSNSKNMFLVSNLLFSVINPIFMITRFVELQKNMEHMVFYYGRFIKYFVF